MNYTGVTWSYTGSEQVFEFTAPTTGTYTFELSQGTNDADFMVMDACSNTANNLIGGYWTGLTNETITLTGGVTYYIIADLYSGASGGTTVSIKVNCPAAGGSDCEDNKVPTGGLTNGYFFTNQLAVDIITNAAGFNIYGTKVNVFVDSGTDLNFSFNFYNDASGLRVLRLTVRVVQFWILTMWEVHSDMMYTHSQLNSIMQSAWQETLPTGWK